MARDVIDAVLGRDGARSPTERNRGASAASVPPSREALARIAERARDDPGGRATSVRRPRAGSSTAMARRRRPSSRSGAELDLDPAARRGPAVRRGRGRVGRPPRAGAVDRRRARPPDAARPGAARPRCRASPRGSPRSSGPSSAGAPRDRRCEVEMYLASARREFSVDSARRHANRCPRRTSIPLGERAAVGE